MICNVGYRQIVNGYCDDVLAGRVATSNAVKAAVRRYLSDVERARTPEFPYYFDSVDAERACEFFPRLLRHYEAPFVGQPFKLEPWQVFIVWNVFGWKREDGTRRFRKAFVLVARKNGKSAFSAGLALFMLFADGEAGAQCFVSATKMEQAQLIFGAAKKMLHRSPTLLKYADARTNNIAFPKNNSFLRPLGSDKPFDGLNISTCLFDELHAWQEYHRKFYDTMTTGSGTRLQPLQVTTTTAADQSGRIYHEEVDYIRGILAGTFSDEEVFGVLYELDEDDDPFDESVWVKANPNLGVSVRLDYLQKQAREAKAKPTTLNRFLRYHCNRNVSSIEGGFTPEMWAKIQGELSDWGEAEKIGAGIDLGGWDDLAAIGFVAAFRVGEDKDGLPLYRYEAKSFTFCSTEGKRDLGTQPFAEWIAGGKLEAGKHVVTMLVDRLVEECERLGVAFVAFDPFNALFVAEHLEKNGLQPVKMPQSHVHFNEPISAVLEASTNGRLIVPADDPVLKWCALNMAFHRNNRDQVMPDKGNSKDKIDAMVAVLMAFKACAASPARVQGSLFVS